MLELNFGAAFVEILSFIILISFQINHFTAWSTLIGRGMSRLGSHWSRVLLAPALLCHKEPARRIQSPLLGALERKIPLAGSLWHKDRWLPCTERSYYRRPYAIKNQRGASKIPQCVPKPLVGGFGCDELVLYGIRELALAIPRTTPRHRGGPLCSKLTNIALQG